MWDRLECSGEEVWLDFSGSGFLLDTDPILVICYSNSTPLHIGLELDSSRQMDLCSLSFGYGYYCFVCSTIGSRLRILKHSMALITHPSYWVALKLWIIPFNLNAPTNSARAQGSQSLSYCNSRQYQFQRTVGYVLLDISVLEPDDRTI